ncbi:MAG: hypothetical protein H0U73_01775 [Tatlockia sp.]|nr:hypothetical protein [Tatlockia sp.]
MLKISDFKLRQEAKARGYRPEMLEKVYPWEQISIEHVKFSVKDICDKLIPVLKNTEAPDM